MHCRRSLQCSLVSCKRKDLPLVPGTRSLSRIHAAAPARGMRMPSDGKGGAVMRIVLFSAIVAAGLSGCAGPEDLPVLEQDGASVGGYRLGTGDQLRVTVFNQAQLTGDYKVAPNGTISMPLIGEVTARGQTTGELEEALVRRLSVEKNLLVDPSVSVQVEA